MYTEILLELCHITILIAINGCYYNVIDNIDGESLWKLMKHCGIPQNVITLKKVTHTVMNCSFS